MPAADAGAAGRPQGQAGRLWVVATPLGNLGDITARAREAIAECDLVACEDTRVTGGLLRHLAISKPMLAYHEHNEKDAAILIADNTKGVIVRTNSAAAAASLIAIGACTASTELA